ncbi:MULTISPECIES: TauD/TfdA family dioxygenase [unclassified Streptomyces]|uniref:TauD/TfdA family dioxygenase n=1 Tax=unclassified Streptomyces TaxID=2593676 RepID=UPI0037FA732A
MPQPCVDSVRADLDADGYAVVDRLGGQRQAVELMQEIGRFVPQYTGAVEHEVVYRSGNDGRAYSQSRNAIRCHTEAPGWDPSPRHLALYCHRQARCGGGHTDLLDLKVLEKLLSPAEHALLTGPRISFPGPQDDAGHSTTVTVPMLCEEDDGRNVLRFSYNLLTAADYDAALDAAADPERLPLGRPGAELARCVSELFDRYRTQVLVPDGCLLIWNNQRMLHARSEYADERRHLTRYWIAA